MSADMEPAYPPDAKRRSQSTTLSCWLQSRLTPVSQHFPTRLERRASLEVTLTLSVTCLRYNRNTQRQVSANCQKKQPLCEATRQASRNQAIAGSSKEDKTSRCINLSRYAPFFFKIGVILIIFNTASAKAMPLMQDANSRAKEIQYVQQLPGMRSAAQPRRSIRSFSDFTQIIRSSSLASTAGGHLRTVRSTTSCSQTAMNLSTLAQHAYKLAIKGFSPKFRNTRSAVSRVHPMNWGHACYHAHTRLKTIVCNIKRNPLIFGSKTNKVKTTIKTMINILQQEMNKEHVDFDHFGSTCNGELDIFSGTKREVARIIQNKINESRSLINSSCIRM